MTGLRLRLLSFVGHMHWIPFGVERVIAMFFDRAKGRDMDFTVDFHDFAYPGNLSDYIDQAVFFRGAYAPHELAVIRDALNYLATRGRAPVSFYDVGANVGHHALFASRYADVVYAFEPLAALREKIDEKTSLNGVGNIEVFPVALSDTAGRARFYLPQGTNKGGGSLMVVNDNREDDFTMVDTVCGDDYIAARGLRRAGVLKIDVEGCERRVLQGLRETLLRDRPVTLMELSDEGRRRFGTEAVLRDALYPDHVIVAIHPRRFGQGYRTKPFSFGHADELLVMPRERCFVGG